MKFKFLFWILLCLQGKVTLCGYFAIVGPRTVQDESFYTASLLYKHSLSDISSATKHEPKTLKVGIEAELQNGFEELEFKTINLTEDLDQNITFALSKTGGVRSHRLVVKDDLDFQQYVKIHHIPKKKSVYIQTDKATYARANTVQIRVFALDLDTKPYQYDAMQIEVKDAVGISRYDRSLDFFDEDRMVFIDSFDIDDDPYFGTWTVHVLVDNEISTVQTFEVKEYVLPRFEAFVTAKKQLTFTEKLNLSVYAKYNFGKYVKGKAKVTAKISGKDTIAKEFSIDNIESAQQLSINTKTDFKITNALRDVVIELGVEFIEELTGQRAFVNETVTISQFFKIKVDRPRQKFKPGFPYDFSVRIFKHDGSIVTTKTTLVNVKARKIEIGDKCTFSKRSVLSNSHKDKSGFLKDGKAKFSFEISKNVKSLTLEIEYLNTRKIMEIGRVVSKSREYMLAELLSPRPSVNNRIEVRVHFSGHPSSFKYVVIGRTGILVNDEKLVAKHENYVSIFFQATATMIPEAHVIVFYIQSTGEIIYDQLTIAFENKLPNKLTIKSSGKTKFRPRQDINFTLKAEPQSTVYLLAVDRSVNIMKSGNNIDQTKIYENLKSHNAYKDIEKLVIEGLAESLTLPQRYDELENSNAYFITNAYDGNLVCSGVNSNGDKELTNSFGDDDASDTVNETDDKETSDVRSDFPETWFFEDVQVDDKGVYNLEKTLPDTITSWDVSGFSLSETYGLGIAKPINIKSFKNFFVSLILPYSIRVGEILKVEALVYSYSSEIKNPLTANVILYSAFDFDETNEITAGSSEENKNSGSSEEDKDSGSNVKPEKETQRYFDFYTSVKEKDSDKFCSYKLSEIDNAHKKSKKPVTVKSMSVSSVFFLIKAVNAGEIEIRVKAEAEEKGKTMVDEVVRKLTVKHDGITHYKNEAFFIDLRSNNNTGYSFENVIPEESIKDSVKMRISAVGDLMGPVLGNLDNLINKPIASSQQKLSAFIPAAVCIKYLNATGNLNSQNRKKYEDVLFKGVNVIVRHRITEGDHVGAFKLWNGKSFATNESDSIWLTAFVVKCLIQAKPLIPLGRNEKYLVDGLTFLKKKQEPDGSFKEYGPITISYIQRSNNSLYISLTAYTAIAFLESGYKDDFIGVITSALKYIEDKGKDISDNYELAIASYALSLSLKHRNQTEEFLKLLEDHAVTKAITTGSSPKVLKFWEKSYERAENSSSPEVMVEIAAFATLAYLKLNLVSKALPIVNWLVSERNFAGGFKSSHDTVIGVQALAEAAILLYMKNVEININLKFEKAADVKWSIDNDNRYNLPGKDIPGNVGKVSFTAVGTGIASIQVEQSFSSKLESHENSFDVKVHTNGTHDLTINVQVNRIMDEGGMVLVELDLPSGYIPDPSFDLLKYRDIKRYELRFNGNTIVLFFDEINTTPVLFEVKAVQSVFVDGLKQSPIRVYDFSNSDRRATVYYEPGRSQEC